MCWPSHPLSQRLRPHIVGKDASWIRGKLLQEAFCFLSKHCKEGSQIVEKLYPRLLDTCRDPNPHSEGAAVNSGLQAVSSALEACFTH